MYLFTRAVRFAPGSTRDVISFVGEVTDQVRQGTGLDFHAWSSTLSPEVGTVVWAVFAEDLATLEQANDKLAASDAFTDLIDRGASLLACSPTDTLAQVVAGDVDPAAPTSQYVGVAQAVPANGSLQAALAGGVEIAEASTRITGVPTLFCVASTGPFGGCAWVSGFDDVGALDRSEAALNADPSWVELIDRVGPAFAPGATQDIYRLAV
jgi:hypothetical protein